MLAHYVVGGFDFDRKIRETLAIVSRTGIFYVFDLIKPSAHTRRNLTGG